MTGFEEPTVQPLLADCRRYLAIFEWPLCFLGLRNRPQQ